MELAAALHHSCGGGLGNKVGLRAQKTASAGPAVFFELSSDDGRPAGGEWPGGMMEPQGHVQRHTVEHIVNIPPFVQILDVPVPQMGDQPVEFLKMHDTVRLPQCPRSLAHPVFFSSSSRTLTFQFPALVVSLATEVFKLFFPEQSSLPSNETADIPVPGRGGSGSGGFQGFHPRQGSLQCTVHQHVDIPVPGGGPHDFLPDPGLAEGSRGFSHSSHLEKSAEVAGSSSTRVHAHSSSSTSALQRSSAGVAYDVHYVEYDERLLVGAATRRDRFVPAGPDHVAAFVIGTGEW